MPFLNFLFQKHRHICLTPAFSHVAHDIFGWADTVISHVGHDIFDYHRHVTASRPLLMTSSPDTFVALRCTWLILLTPSIIASCLLTPSLTLSLPPFDMTFLTVTVIVSRCSWHLWQIHHHCFMLLMTSLTQHCHCLTVLIYRYCFFKYIVIYLGSSIRFRSLFMQSHQINLFLWEEVRCIVTSRQIK